MDPYIPDQPDNSSPAPDGTTGDGSNVTSPFDTAETPPDPEALVHTYQYVRDFTLTAAAYVVGEPIDTVKVRQWLADQGIDVTTVTAEIGPDGSSTTGIIFIETPIIAEDIVVNLAGTTEVTGTTAAATVTSITTTAVGTVPATYTYSGQIDANLEARLQDGSAAQSVNVTITVGGDTVIQSFELDENWKQIQFSLPATAIPAGTVNGALTAVVPASGDDLSLRNATLTGALFSDQAKGEEVDSVTWATYASERAEDIVETAVIWGETVEGDGRLDPPAGNSTNYCINPKPVTTTYWRGLGTSVSFGMYGEWMQLLRTSGSGTMTIATGLTNNASPVAYAGPITVSATLAQSISTMYTTIRVQWYNAANGGGSLLRTDTMTPPAIANTAAGSRHSYTTPTAPGGAVSFVVSFVTIGSTSTFSAIRVKQVQIERTSAATPYFDGSMGGDCSWSGTANASTSIRLARQIADNPDKKRIVGLWRWMEANGIEVKQIVGNWNFATPLEAPEYPTLMVQARGVVDDAITDLYEYSEISDAELDLFKFEWTVARSESKLTLKQEGDVEQPNQPDNSSVILIESVDPPTGDVRDGDIWQTLNIPVDQYLRINGQWVEQDPALPIINQNSMAAGRRSIVTDQHGVAVGVMAEVLDSNSVGVGYAVYINGFNSVGAGSQVYIDADMATAIGAFTRVTADYGVAVGQTAAAYATDSTALGAGSTVYGARAIALGAGAYAGTDDTSVIRSNRVSLERSTTTGMTELGLQSPDGTMRWLSITNALALQVDGISQTHAAATVTDTASVNMTLTGQDIKADVIFGTTSTTVAAGNHTHSEFSNWKQTLSSNQSIAGTTAVPSLGRAVITFTVTGAVTTDTVIISPDTNLAAGLFIAYSWVSAADTVSMALGNMTGASVNQGARSYRIRVIKT